MMSETPSEDEVEELESRQRLKAALHYTVGNICNEVKEPCSRELVAIITETAFKQAQLLATDLELFAKHAKRTTVSVEDVRLCSRRNASLLEHITKEGEKLHSEKEVKEIVGGTSSTEIQTNTTKTLGRGKGKKKIKAPI